MPSSLDFLLGVFLLPIYMSMAACISCCPSSYSLSSLVLFFPVSTADAWAARPQSVRFGAFAVVLVRSVVTASASHLVGIFFMK